MSEPFSQDAYLDAVRFAAADVVAAVDAVRHPTSVVPLSSENPVEDALDRLQQVVGQSWTPGDSERGDARPINESQSGLVRSETTVTAATGLTTGFRDASLPPSLAFSFPGEGQFR